MTYNPSVGLARLYECVSKKGQTYFRGRMGLVNVVVLKSDQVSDSGQPIWYLKVSEPENATEQRQPQAGSRDRRNDDPLDDLIPPVRGLPR